MCTCIAQINERLKGHNTKIATVFGLDDTLSVTGERAKLATEKIDPNDSRPVLNISAHYCPFCGIEVVR